MSSHPDADAFMRKYLEQPADATTRLVFADWLEETGQPHNAAWAYYIRLKAEGGRYTLNSHERQELDCQADEYAPKILANLTIPAAHFVGYPRSFLELLPAPNITAKLRDFEIPVAILELMPESVARENYVIPLAEQCRTLILAAVDPRDFDLAQKLKFILNRQMILVGAEREDVQAAIDRFYGQTETESVSSVHYDMPVFALGLGSNHDYRLGGVIVEFFQSEARGFEFGPAGDVAELRLIEPRHPPNQRIVFPLETLTEMIRQLMALDYTHEQCRPDRVIREVEARTVGNRIQRYVIELNRAALHPTLTVRWLT